MSTKLDKFEKRVNKMKNVVFQVGDKIQHVNWFYIGSHLIKNEIQNAIFLSFIEMIS